MRLYYLASLTLAATCVWAIPQPSARHTNTHGGLTSWLGSVISSVSHTIQDVSQIIRADAERLEERLHGKAAEAGHQTAIEVKTPWGKMKGARVERKSFGAQISSVVFNVRYAIADRWQSPALAFTSSTDAPPACPQSAGAIVTARSTNESCLWMRVWAPESAPHGSPSLPVLFW